MVNGTEINLVSICTHTSTVTIIRVSDLSVTIINKANPNEPTKREGFWANKLNSFIPRGLNQHDFF